MKNLSETLRKSIHLSSLVIPLSYRYILNYNKNNAFILILAALVISLLIEMHRLWQDSFARTFNLMFGNILRKHELKSFTGATYLLLASLLCITFFSPEIASASIAFLSIGDTFAALVGINFGKRKFIRNGKSLEGSIACFASCLIFGLFWLNNPWLAVIGALVATIAELALIEIDDNIVIPLSSGLIMSIVKLFI
ncbi:MAG: phosphatidate cytidylyltransferase [Candidatus Cloacimonetes bacterium]|jgi:dolichol kinase|nr:phosphatidate cytidylyltransferase [Candidatus Cloacimonadota bacterium]